MWMCNWGRNLSERNGEITLSQTLHYLYSFWNTGRIEMSDWEIHAFREEKSKIHHRANLHFECSVLAAPLAQGTKQSKGEGPEMAMIRSLGRGASV